MCNFVSEKKYDLHNIELIRKKLLRKFILLAIPIVIIVLLLLYFSISLFLTMPILASMLFVSFVVMLLLLFASYSLQNEKFNKILKSKGVRSSINSFYNDINVNYHSHSKFYKPNISVLLNQQSFYYRNKYITDIHDIILGQIYNAKFKICEIITLTARNTLYSAYDGIIADIDFDNNISENELLLKPKRLYNSINFNNLKLSKFKIEGATLYTNDIKRDVSCFNVIFKNFKFLRSFYKTNNISIYVNKNKVIIAINTNRNLFPSVTLLKKVQIPNYTKNINPIFEFIIDIKENFNF